MNAIQRFFYDGKFGGGTGTVTLFGLQKTVTVPLLVPLWLRHAGGVTRNDEDDI
jgi:hypothetical protein